MFGTLKQIIVLWLLQLMICTLAIAAEPVLQIGTKEAPPFAIKSADGTWSGISIELWHEIAEDLGVEFEFIEKDLQGLLDGVAAGELDAAVAALTVTAEREQLMDFSHPFYTTGLGIAVHDRGDAGWLQHLRYFVTDNLLNLLKVALVLAVILFGVGLLMWWFERKTNSQQFGGSIRHGLGAAFWWAAVTMTTVGYGDKAPRSGAGRVVATIWMFTAIVLISSFTAAFTSSLTIRQLGSVVNGPEDLHKVRVGTVVSSTAAEYLRKRRVNATEFEDANAAMRALKSKTIGALVYDAPILRYLVNQDDDSMLRVLPGTFLRQDYAIAVPSGQPLRERINRELEALIDTEHWQRLLFVYLGQDG